jgi:hypothetical protein
MAWERSPQGLIDLFVASLPETPGLERRTMFGCPVALVNGHMVAGLLQGVAFMRLPPGLRAEVEAEFGARHFEPMPGRPMKTYVALPDEVLEDEDRYAALLAAACAFASALPPKAKKAPKAKR